MYLARFVVFVSCFSLTSTEVKVTKQHNKYDKKISQLKKSLAELKLQLERVNKTVSDHIKERARSTPVCPISTTKRPVSLPQKSCASLYKSGARKDDVYIINPDGLGSFQVRCDMTTDGGGWTVFQRRQDGSEDFYRGWSDYKAGFGDLNREFWLGLDKIHRLTKSGQNVLRIDLMDFKNDKAFAKYGTFTVASETDSYKLNISSFSGTAGDSLKYHNGMKFTTKDRDNDQYGNNCAVTWEGAWWYNGCYYSNLNGLYLKPPGEKSWKGIVWRYWKFDNDRSMKKAEMKTRPAQF